jgi:hypothetical protein
MAKKKPKLQAFKIIIERDCYQYRYVMARSAKHARDMFEGEVDGIDEAEYAFGESVGNETIVDVIRVKK